MKHLILLIAFLGILISCTKETNTNKQLDGNWSIYSIRIVEPSGLSYSATDDNGNFSFSSAGKKSTNGDYSFLSSFTYDSKNIEILESGIYQLSENDVTRTTSTGDTYNSRVVYINSENMEFEYHDASMNTYFFILEQN